MDFKIWMKSLVLKLLGENDGNLSGLSTLSRRRRSSFKRIPLFNGLSTVKHMDSQSLLDRPGLILWM